MAWINDNPPKEIKDYWKRVYPDINTINGNISIIKKNGYKLIGYFLLPEDAWWDLYYNPLEKRLEELRIESKENSEAIEMIEETQLEIDLYRKYNHWYGSVFL